ncbi:MAG: hypothetical protein KJ971_03315 [Firmicutes bacterium]|nr:hypothetical protein [Bacillota bacterium]
MKISKKYVKANIVEVTVETPNGSVFAFINIGAALTKWITSDNTQIVASYQDYLDYFKPGMYLGTNVGLTAGRIKDGRFSLDNITYQFENPEINLLHFGKEGISFKEFSIFEEANEDNKVILRFSLDYQHSVLPGMQRIDIFYTITDNCLFIEYKVVSTETTICNVTNHSYFNLDGDFDYEVKSHFLEVKSPLVVIPNKRMIGDLLLNVQDTIFDFRNEKQIIPVINDRSLQEDVTKGLDHYFILSENEEFNVCLSSKKTNRKLYVSTNYPGITIYSTNYPDKSILHTSRPLAYHSAIAIEPHFQSNAINDSRFLTYILEPNRTYEHFIEYRLEESA